MGQATDAGSQPCVPHIFFGKISVSTRAMLILQNIAHDASLIGRVVHHSALR
jgi:hypothetical protein